MVSLSIVTWKKTDWAWPFYRPIERLKENDPIESITSIQTVWYCCSLESGCFVKPKCMAAIYKGKFYFFHFSLCFSPEGISVRGISEFVDKRSQHVGLDNEKVYGRWWIIEDGRNMKNKIRKWNFLWIGRVVSAQVNQLWRIHSGYHAWPYYAGRRGLESCSRHEFSFVPETCRKLPVSYCVRLPILFLILFGLK